MATKPKAKRPGRPRLAKEARREVLPVRLPPGLVARVKALKKYATPAEVVELALTYWLDTFKDSAREMLARRSQDNQSGDGK